MIGVEKGTSPTRETLHATSSDSPRRPGARRRLPRSGGSRGGCCGQTAAAAPLRRLDGQDPEVRQGPGAARHRCVPGRDGRRLPARRRTRRLPKPDPRLRGHRLAAPGASGHGRSRLGGDLRPAHLHRLERLAGRDRVAARNVCPNDWNRQRVDASGPLTPRFPQFCATNPFTLGSVWGIDRGWAIGLDDVAPAVRLPLGTYTVKVSLAPRYAAMFGVAPADATTTVTAHIVRPLPVPAECGGVASHRRARNRPAVPASGGDRQLSRSEHDARPDPASGVGDGHRSPGRP